MQGIKSMMLPASCNVESEAVDLPLNPGISAVILLSYIWVFPWPLVPSTGEPICGVLCQIKTSLDMPESKVVALQLKMLLCKESGSTPH